MKYILPALALTLFLTGCGVLGVRKSTAPTEVVPAETAATAAPAIAEGNTGSLSWVLSAAGTLTVTGEGAMPDDGGYGIIPWYSHREKIKTVVIGDGVTAIGKYAFNDCKALTDVTIGAGVKSIGHLAFSLCYNVRHVICLAAEPPVMLGIELGNNNFRNYGAAITLHVPAASVSAYRNTADWKGVFYYIEAILDTPASNK